MVDPKSGNNLLYLPLDKLIAQTAAADADAPLPRAQRRRPPPPPFCHRTPCRQSKSISAMPLFA